MLKIGIIIIVAFFLSSCKSDDNKNYKPVVSVSLVPQKYWIDRLSGDAVDVNVMVVSGASHSTYEPTPQQMKHINSSQLYFRLGYIDFEQVWMEKFQNSNPDMKVVDLSEGFDLESVVAFPCSHDHGEGHNHHAHTAVDPHIWLNPPMVKTMVERIARELRMLLPTDADSIRIREKEFLSEIDSLDAYISQCFSNLENRKFLLFHPALTWYALNYGLEQIVVEVDGKEPSASTMKQIIETVRNENIKVVMIQSEFSTDRAESIARETNAQIVHIEPMAYDWVANMYKLTKIIEQSLQKSQEK